jgi:hypothetical protein
LYRSLEDGIAKTLVASKLMSASEYFILTEDLLLRCEKFEDLIKRPEGRKF